MVQVTGFSKQQKDGKEFFILNLEGDIEFVKSKESGKHYATSRKCSISSTFSEMRCQRLVGRNIPGRIDKVETDPYDYKIPDSDEVIQLTHAFIYNPEETVEDTVFEVSRA